MNQKSGKPIPIVLIIIMVVAVGLVIVLHADPAQTIIGMLIGIVLLVVLVDGGNKRVLSRRIGIAVQKEIDSGVPFQAAISPDVFQLLKDGKKVEAIKELRTATGEGLMAAKDRLDEVFLRMEMGQEIIAIGSAAPVARAVSHDAPEKVVELVRSGKKIEAVKELRESSGAGLAEAKRIVDEIADSI